jgi:hypothetical protein
MTNPSQPSDFLLDQFEAICSFEERVKNTAPALRVGAVKNWFYLNQFHVLRNYPDVVKLCLELEKVVPLDHYYWSDPRGFRFE